MFFLIPRNVDDNLNNNSWLRCRTVYSSTQQQEDTTTKGLWTCALWIWDCFRASSQAGRWVFWWYQFTHSTNTHIIHAWDRPTQSYTWNPLRKVWGKINLCQAPSKYCAYLIEIIMYNSMKIIIRHDKHLWLDAICVF